MSRTKKQYKPPPYATNNIKDKYAPIHESVIKSKAFQSLNHAEKNLYIMCRVHAHTDKGCKAYYGRIKEYGEEYKGNGKEGEYFVIPKSHLKEYGFDSGNASRYISKLEQVGLIDYVEKGKNQHITSIYKFSERWKEWAGNK